MSATSPPARPYADPYLCGVGIGLVLLAAYVLVGRGLGASGAFASVAAAGTAAVSGGAASNPALAPYLERGVASPLADWLVLEILGLLAGGFFSAWRAGRLRPASDTPALTARGRALVALAGGALMGVGARLAHGCTSGLALTGGALLATGSWIFIGSCFAAGYLAAPLLRGAWR